MDDTSAIPDASTTWPLWHYDTFDADSSPSLQASGQDILQGLYALWLHTLKEGIQDNGSASFSSFHLTWGNTPSARVDPAVQPFRNLALVKLRQWACLTVQDQESTAPPPAAQERRISILKRLAELHYEFLEKSQRWTSRAIDWSAEARELVARVEATRAPQEL